MNTPPEDLPQAVREALAQGNKIEAIKRLREATGLGLAEAKQRVEGGAPLGTGQSTLTASVHSLPAEVVAALARGDEIGAIRLLRSHTGLGLKEAKERIEAAAETGGAMPPSPQVPRSAGAIWWAAVLVALVAAWFVLR